MTITTKEEYFRSAYDNFQRENDDKTIKIYIKYQKTKTASVL